MFLRCVRCQIGMEVNDARRGQDHGHESWQDDHGAAWRYVRVDHSGQYDYLTEFILDKASNLKPRHCTGLSFYPPPNFV